MNDVVLIGVKILKFKYILKLFENNLWGYYLSILRKWISRFFFVKMGF